MSWPSSRSSTRATARPSRPMRAASLSSSPWHGFDMGEVPELTAEAAGAPSTAEASAAGGLPAAAKTS